MAMADYRLCDMCGCKAFYDANLNYEWPDRDGNISFGRHVEPHEIVRDSGHVLDHLGDWAVICTECAKTHKCVVVPIEDAPNSNSTTDSVG